MSCPPEMLLNLQRRFKTLLLDEGISPSPTWLRDRSSAELATRIEVYRYAYWARMIESLEDDFARCKNLLGPSIFRELARNYLAQHPSTFASLAEVSRGFPDFLATSPIRSSTPGSPDLARWEWLEILSFLEEERESNLAAMVNVPEDQIHRVVFELNPSARWFESDFPVHRKRFNATRSSTSGTIRLILFHSARCKKQIVLTAKQADLLREVERGRSLGELRAISAKLRIREEQASKWFGRWTTLGLILGFHLDDAGRSCAN